MIKEHGAEILRLWTASVEFNEDVRMSETILTRLTEAYRKLRNTFRYMLGNLADFDPRTGRGAGRRLAGDRSVDSVTRRGPGGALPRLVRRIRVPKVYHAVYAFATVDLSAVYFDVLKDRLYTSARSRTARRSAQTALYRLLDALVRLCAPIMGFTAEEVWRHMGRRRASTWQLFPEPAK